MYLYMYLKYIYLISGKWDSRAKRLLTRQKEHIEIFCDRGYEIGHAFNVVVNVCFEIIVIKCNGHNILSNKLR